MKNEQYLTWISKALVSFQLVEEALKQCIGVSYEIIAASNPLEVDFKFSPTSINDAPLGKLIKMFSNVSKNETLVEELKSKDILKWRNFFAHNAFMHEFMNRTSKSSCSPHSVNEVEVVARYVAGLGLKLRDEFERLQSIHVSVCGGQRET